MKYAWVILALTLFSCSQVPAGNVGVKVYLLGGSKGVDHEVLGVGRYWIGMNEQLFIFPTFQQNYVWTKSPHEGKADDESITFQTAEGMIVNADIGISYHINPEKVSVIFQKYRKGVDEITDVYLRNYVRDELNRLASSMTVEEVYGKGKVKLFSDAKKTLASNLNDEGIVIDNLYLIGSFRLPSNVEAALNSKIEATQKAQQRENEVAEARAQAEKEIAIAKGVAESNRIKAQSLSAPLIEWEKVQKWDGKLPQVQGSGSAILDIRAAKN